MPYLLVTKIKIKTLNEDRGTFIYATKFHWTISKIIFK